MNKVEESLQELLERANFLFRNEDITTECIKDCNSISLFGESFGPYEKGKKYKIKYFIATSFIENNILKVSSSEKYDNIDVQRFAINEKDNQQLISHTTVYFLNKIKEFKKIIEKETIERNRPKVDLDRYNSYASNIIDTRLLKLLRLAKTELSLTEERNLTTSEKFLYQKLYDLIYIWREFFLKK